MLDRIISGVEQFGFRNGGWIESPLKGAEGNTEFLACFERIPMPEPHAEAEAEPEAVVEAQAEAKAEAEPEPEREET